MTAPTPAPRDDAGSGVLSTSLGITVFVALLLLATQTLTNLWVRALVDDVAVDAASKVALSGATGMRLAEVERRALGDARAALGRFAEHVVLAFETDPDGEFVVVRVRGDGLRFVPDALSPLAELDRRVAVRRESIE
jgi:hypothetical protein